MVLAALFTALWFLRIGLHTQNARRVLLADMNCFDLRSLYYLLLVRVIQRMFFLEAFEVISVLLALLVITARYVRVYVVFMSR